MISDLVANRKKPRVVETYVGREQALRSSGNATPTRTAMPEQRRARSGLREMLIRGMETPSAAFGRVGLIHG